MVEYNIVKYCNYCKKRFVVGKGDKRKVYCDNCQKKADKHKAKNE